MARLIFFIGRKWILNNDAKHSSTSNNTGGGCICNQRDISSLLVNDDLSGMPLILLFEPTTM
jgi:hypothetical protein